MSTEPGYATSEMTPWGPRATVFRDRHCAECIPGCAACGKGRNEPHGEGCGHICTHTFQQYAPASPAVPPVLRPEVLEFARRMSAAIDAHNHDRGEYGWRSESPAQLAAYLDRYLAQFALAITYNDKGDIKAHAVNVANLAMMIAEVA
jgi:hypothetical protein